MKIAQVVFLNLRFLKYPTHPLHFFLSNFGVSHKIKNHEFICFNSFLTETGCKFVGAVSATVEPHCKG